LLAPAGLRVDRHSSALEVVERVDRVGFGGGVAAVDLPVQVGAGGVSGGADDADGLADGRLLPDGDGGSVEQVAVAGGDQTRVSDLGVLATAFHRRGSIQVAGVGALLEWGVAGNQGHGPGCGGADDGALGRGEVDAVSSCLFVLSGYPRWLPS
jgi:hypothetical protein